MSEPMLTIHNRHSAACGIPPAVSTEAADLYIGYFENRHGEQWIFTFDRATREARLRGRDAGHRPRACGIRSLVVPARRLSARASDGHEPRGTEWTRSGSPELK
jgi:hypothetical protein